MTHSIYYSTNSTAPAKKSLSSAKLKTSTFSHTEWKDSKIEADKKVKKMRKLWESWFSYPF